MTGARLHALLAPLVRAGVLLTLCIAPTQWAVELRPKLFLSPADLTLAATAGLWLLDLAATGGWRRLPALLPWPNLLFVAAAAAAAAAAPFKALAAKDLIQLVEYFIVGHLLFADYLRADPRACGRALRALAAVTALILGLAALHYFSPALEPLEVRGTFGNRNVLGGYLALALPLAFGGLLAARAWPARLGLALLLLAGLTVNLSGAAFLAVAGALACLAAARGPRVFLPVAVLLVVWQAAVLPRLPRENDLVHFQSVALYDAGGEAERRYPDWQAATSMLLTHPWLGAGLGNYQKHVGQFYDSVPRRTGPAEPDTQNLYLVLAASAGLPALLAFLALLAAPFGAPRAAPAADPGRAGLALGTAGAVAAFAVAAVWHPLLVRGIGLPLVFVLALARHARSPEVTDGT